ncbi:MAG: DUF3843 family protein [Deltaproteobacteria bacterium]|nr:DUF3843 family protein [Deltaproteobacteria bacterium]
MNLYIHRPNQHLERGERALMRIATELTSFLLTVQRSLTFETLHLSKPQRETVAHLLVEFAEDVYQDIGIWRSLEQYNRDFFGTPLPCLLPADAPVDAQPVTPARVQYFLWTLYSELDPELTLAPQHRDLTRLASEIAAFLHERFSHVRFDSGVKTFLTQPNTYGWDVKKKLIWLGQHSYLFRLSFGNYVRAHGGKPDIPTIDDFLCQETTAWSGLGVIDLLAALLDITDEQRATLRGWYERHTAYFRVVTAREPVLELVNLLNERSYSVRVEGEVKHFQEGGLVFGALVPWDGLWYWSGVQQTFGVVPDETLQSVLREFPRKASQIVYRYCESQAAKAREIVGKHYRQFLAYYGKDFVHYSDNRSMAEDLRKFYRYQQEATLKDLSAADRQKYARANLLQPLVLPPELLNMKNGVGLYFHPAEGQELMAGFNAIVSGLRKQGEHLTEDEAASLKSFLHGDAISPEFVRAVVRAYGDASIATVFLIQREAAPGYLEYLLRRYKGHFYRRRYPSLTLVNHEFER